LFNVDNDIALINTKGKVVYKVIHKVINKLSTELN